MNLKMTVSNVTAINNDIWEFEMPPHQMRLFGTPSNSVGPRSIVLLRNHVFDKTAKTLSFDADAAIPVNIGTHSTSIAIAASSEGDDKREELQTEQSFGQTMLGRGDREFLEMANLCFSESMQVAAEALLKGVRNQSPGELKKGKSRNFSETPDNFWYVIIQPRIEQLSITVRGTVEHFEPVAKLSIKDDRGNTLFKITCEADIPAALELIFHAIRK